MARKSCNTRKGCKARKRSGGKTKKGSRSRRGGDASTWLISNFGDGNTQYDNTFGPNPMYPSGTLIPTVAGAPAILSDNIPQGSNASLQQGGKKRRKGKKGGYWAAVIQQALVPFGLLGLQHTYARRKGRANNSTKKNRD
jgi:hypothetical protein